MVALRKPALETVVRQIVEIVQSSNLVESDAWSDLEALSSNTSVDAVEVDPAGVILQADGSFEGSANVYVSLDYGPKADGVHTTESFIGRFRGRVPNGQPPTIEAFSVDTSPFYEGAEELGVFDENPT